MPQYVKAFLLMKEGGKSAPEALRKVSDKFSLPL
jgi:hypothetical protein